MDLKLKCKKKPLRGGVFVCVIELSGKLDMSNDDVLHKKIVEIMDEGILYFVLDFSDVRYFDSNSLGFLMLLIENNIRIHFAGISKKDAVVMDMLGLTTFFDSYQTQQIAISSFKKNLDQYRRIDNFLDHESGFFNL